MIWISPSLSGSLGSIIFHICFTFAVTKKHKLYAIPSIRLVSTSMMNLACVQINLATPALQIKGEILT